MYKHVADAAPDADALAANVVNVANPAPLPVQHSHGFLPAAEPLSIKSP